eukprot:TRINITY_DN60178_c0_g1_i1.p1 TRINITY_DN60178_c0_g1~~TRINITY_DN60178_c0_g1_i1.p1  ORF type:complete len:308 (+),score=31.45 TRINITY_DN60178_c0_g1_i1:221-1144(+)
MGWGGKGKGPKGPAPIFPHAHHHHWPGARAFAVAAEGAVVGGVITAAVVASRVSRPRRPSPRSPCVVVANPQPVYVSGAGVAYPLKGKGKGKSQSHALAVPHQPLNISFVRLPADAVQTRGSVTFFAIDMTMYSGEIWRIFRRYNEFHDLNERLAKPSHPGAPFPGKTFMACTGRKLDERRQWLELWLQRTIERPESNGPAWLASLKQFLESGRQAVGAPPPPAVNTGVAEATRSTPPALSSPDSDPQDESGVLEIVVPDGISAGQLLGVTVPNGKQLTLVLPEGYSAGARIEILYEPQTDTLTLLT